MFSYSPALSDLMRILVGEDFPIVLTRDEPDHVEEQYAVLNGHGLPVDYHRVGRDSLLLAGRVAHLAAHVLAPGNDVEVIPQLLKEKPLLTSGIAAYWKWLINNAPNQETAKQLIEMGREMRVIHEHEAERALIALVRLPHGEPEPRLCGAFHEHPLRIEDLPLADSEHGPIGTGEGAGSGDADDSDFLEAGEPEAGGGEPGQDDKDSEGEPSDSDEGSDSDQDTDGESSSSKQDADKEPSGSNQNAEQENSSEQSESDETEEEQGKGEGEGGDLLIEEEPEILMSEEQENKFLARKAERDAQKVSERVRAANIATQAGANVFTKKPLAFGSRDVNADDRMFLTKLRRELVNAKWRAPRETEIASRTPPGRLSSRDAVTWTAQRTMGIPTTAEPFRQTIITSQTAPPPVVGVICDLSGSMAPSAVPMAKLIWALSNAVPDVGGRFAAVGFNTSVHNFVKPEMRLKSVPTIKVSGTDTAACDALNAIAGGLKFFSKESGVKAVVIASDGMWDASVIRATKNLIQKLDQIGVHVLWVPFMPRVAQGTMMDGAGIIVENDYTPESIKQLPMDLGKAIARLVKNE